MKLKIFPLDIVLFITFLFILTSCSYGDKNSIEEKLQKVLDDGISKYDVRGVSAAVIFPDQKVWKGVSGISHDTVSMKPDMLFAIGSIPAAYVLHKFIIFERRKWNLIRYSFNEVGYAFCHRKYNQEYCSHTYLKTC